MTGFGPGDKNFTCGWSWRELICGSCGAEIMRISPFCRAGKLIGAEGESIFMMAPSVRLWGGRFGIAVIDAEGAGRRGTGAGPSVGEI